MHKRPRLRLVVDNAKPRLASSADLSGLPDLAEIERLARQAMALLQAAERAQAKNDRPTPPDKSRWTLAQRRDIFNRAVGFLDDMPESLEEKQAMIRAQLGDDWC